MLLLQRMRVNRITFVCRLRNRSRGNYFICGSSSVKVVASAHIAHTFVSAEKKRSVNYQANTTDYHYFKAEFGHESQRDQDYSKNSVRWHSYMFLSEVQCLHCAMLKCRVHGSHLWSVWECVETCK